MILSDKQIRRLALEHGMIAPFVDYKEKESTQAGKITWGLSSCGYDFRLDWEFAKPRSATDDDSVVDPKKSMLMRSTQSRPFVLAPRKMILGQTMEGFIMPDDVMGIIYTRSTLARIGLFLNVTQIEPGWQGQITLEISNISDEPIGIYPGEGIGQLVFMQISERPERTYAHKQGKYQDQHGVTGPIVK